MDSGSVSESIALPERIDRYRVLELLGRGGFGYVYRAIDETLDREVAVKVPRSPGGDFAELQARWIAEAQVVASLDHPHIVPVYDVGSTDAFPFFVISKLISGANLRAHAIRHSVTVDEAVDWAASIAEALSIAHARGLVHRDIKPSNILIDEERHAWLTDFGLVLREADMGKGPANLFIGTYHYMSPEQARGEGHLVDGRCDIFALGIVLYELLTGKRPFQGESSKQLLTNIVRAEPRPLRSRNLDLPVELERICLKALAKRVSDRYSTANDMADDLRRFSREPRQTSDSGTEFTVEAEPSTRIRETVSMVEDSTRRRETTIVPRGLRAFDEHDQSFFLRLLPGPRDMDGVPETIRRWKVRIESDSAEDSFRVGLIFGASGSGKSSLVRAGLIPLLDTRIDVAFVEASGSETEARLMRALPTAQDAPETDTLVRRIASLRHAPAEGRKVLIVLDQFEQWLHQQQRGDNLLIDALRQCDGVHVQCLVLIRDDFWMEATRFFHDLDVRLVDGVNSAAVDRFDLRHARYVMAEFGRAYGCLPTDEDEMSAEQHQFLTSVIGAVQENGQVISIHLVLLAQMLRGREWGPRTLAQFGGAEGIGVDFLNAAFDQASAAPQHRARVQPARAVLAALLPDAGTNIKGKMRSANELRTISGLDSRGFDELVDVLDSQLRLITPTTAETDPASAETSAGSGPCFYQLTHDFLVPALRSWLTQQRRETASGRARLRMEELSQLWKRKPEHRYLPGGLEFLRLSLLAPAATRSRDEAKMMRTATRYYSFRWGLAAVAVGLMLLGGLQFRRQSIREAEQRESTLLVDQYLSARTDQIPRSLEQLRSQGEQARARLRAIHLDPEAEPQRKIRAAMVLADSDPSAVRTLIDAVPGVETDFLMMLTDMLSEHSQAAARHGWQQLEARQLGEPGWLNTAYLLARLAPADPRWRTLGTRLADAFVNQNSTRASQLAAGFALVSDSFTPGLCDIYRDSKRGYSQRLNAAVGLAACLGEQDALLVDLLCTATPGQFEQLFPRVASRQESTRPHLLQTIESVPEPIWPTDLVEQETAPAASVIDRLERAAGLITHAFAVCQTLPLSDFEALAKEMTELGYRPEVVRPYRRENDVLVAAVWCRDGLDWQWSMLEQPEALAETQRLVGERNLLPCDVALIPARGKQPEQYAVLWRTADASMIDAEIYIDVLGAEHKSHWEPLNQDGYVPKSNLIQHREGKSYFSSVRRKLRINPAYRDAWDDDEQRYRQRTRDGWYQVDVRLSGSPELSYAGTWLNGGPWESETVDRCDLTDHGAEMKRLAALHYRPASIAVLETELGLEATSVWHRPVVLDRQRDRLASRKANAAVALFRLGDRESIWPMLTSDHEPRLRSFLIDRLGPLHADPKPLVARLADPELDAHQQASIVAALSRFRPESLARETAMQLRARVEQLGTTSPAAELHAVCRYLGATWNWDDLSAKIARADSPQTPPADGTVTWERSPSGHQLSIIPGPAEFPMGSPGHEAFRDHSEEAVRRVRIPRTFAIGCFEVTVEQYREFDPSFSYATDYTPSENCPANMVSWFGAMRYCRWLCEAEEIDEAEIPYPPLDEIKPGMQLPADFLERSGYRLPTEAEWEYACRAECNAARHYGGADELLARYAWTAANSEYRLQPVGRLLPNAFGLFDSLGNVMELCFARHQFGNDLRGRLIVDGAETELQLDNEVRVARGSAFLYSPSSARSASLEPIGSTTRKPYVGFRIARTVRP